MLLGALVADAASLGVHWIYEPERLADIAERREGSAAFVPVDAQNYANTKGYFAHADRQDGMMTQYGEALYLAMRVMLQNGGAFDVAAYQSAFSAHFGPGGRYSGYIDRPTRAALENIGQEILTPSGTDDDQLPAVSRLPAIMARYLEAPDLQARAKAAMEVTNVNDVASDYTDVFIDLFKRLAANAPLADALDAVARAAPEPLREGLLEALSTQESSSTEYAGVTGRACHLPMAGPLIFHILKHATSYRDAVERNLLAGGDNAGRAPLIGAVMGLLHGLDGPHGVPLEWVLSVHQSDKIWEACHGLGHARS